MKTILCTLVLTYSLFLATGLSAQTIYNINTNTTFTKAGIPTQCINCTINIADGVTFKIDKDVFFQNVSIAGASNSSSSIEITDKNVTFWSPGSFSNIAATFNKGGLINSGALTITNSKFVFSRGSFATVYTSIALVSSTWKFEDNSTMEATGGVFSIKNGGITVGDGSALSTASVRFNGASLSLLDATSSVTVANNKNAYFNWSPYNGNGNTITTTNNNINCGSGKNACSAPMVYGPATLSAAGVASSAVLPVKLVSFNGKVNGNTVTLNWTSAQEKNSDFFVVERSVDGLHWASAGVVQAKGNSFVPSSYSFNDVVKGGAVYSYRLKMVDQDESAEYSAIIKFNVGTATHTLIKTYPNPATTFVVIDGAAGTQVSIINMNGAVVKQINHYAANNKISLDGIAPGNYVLKVTEANGTSYASKLTVTR